MTAIATKRLFLLPPTVADIKTQVMWLNDPIVTRFSEQRHRKHDIQTQCHYIESFVPPSQLWSIVRDGSAIGTISARVDKHNNVADVGIMLGDRSCWGQGFGTEAWQIVMDYLFYSGLRKIEAGHMEANEPMAAICRRSRMQQEGCRLMHFDRGDHEYSHMILWGRLNWQ